METVLPVAKRIHPLFATAAVAVTLVSFAGVAAITGLLPSSHSTSAPSAPNITQTAPLADNKAVSEYPVPAPVHKHAAVPAPAPHHTSSVPVHRLAPAKPQLAQQEAPRPVAPAIKPAPVCNSCGRVESVATIQAEAEQTSGIGVAAGAVLGGLLGHQIGGGNGRTLATVAGAVGGSLAGNEVERRTRATPSSYQVRVRMEDGSMRSFPYSAAPNWNAGDRVQVVNGQLSNQG